MTFTLELTPEQVARLKAEAARSKLSVDEYIRHRLFGETAPQSEDETERLAAIDQAMGTLAGTGISSEDFMREKHDEIEHEEILWQQRYGSRKE